MFNDNITNITSTKALPLLQSNFQVFPYYEGENFQQKYSMSIKWILTKSFVYI